jgi:dTDP-4-dehydrorhamnose 3,5-epimerase
MDSFSVQPLQLPGVLLITPTRHDDERGYFVEGYNAQIFEQLGIPAIFVQDSVSRSRKDVLRGMHFQKSPHGHAKLVRCTQGEIFDVAADVDITSPTYGQHVSAHLSGDTQAMLYIPSQYAHGFCVVSDEATVEYKMGAVVREAASGVMYNDPVLSIGWPVSHPVLSVKDQSWPALPRV